MVYVVLYNIGGEKGLIYNMYTILQEEKNIEGVVKTTYGIKCEEMAVNDVSPNKKEVIVQVLVLNPEQINLTGGEPLIRPDFCEILEYLRANYKATAIFCWTDKEASTY